MHHTLNPIVWEFAGGGETSFAKKGTFAISWVEKTSKATFSFSEKDVVGIHSHNDDPMVIVVKCEDWEIKRVTFDQGSYVDI